MTDREPESRRQRPGGRSARIKSSVQRAAIEILEEVGYEALQLPDVAARAGVNKTTVYRRWPTKAHLVDQLVRDMAADQVPTPDTGSLHSDLTTFLTDVANMIAMPAVKAVIQSRIPQPGDSPETNEARATYWAQRFGQSTEIVKRAIERGELRPTTDPHVFLEYASGLIYFRRLVTDEPVDADLIETIAKDIARTFHA